MPGSAENGLGLYYSPLMLAKVTMRDKRSIEILYTEMPDDVPKHIDLRIVGSADLKRFVNRISFLYASVKGSAIPLEKKEFELLKAASKEYEHITSTVHF